MLGNKAPFDHFHPVIERSTFQEHIHHPGLPDDPAFPLLRHLLHNQIRTSLGAEKQKNKILFISMFKNQFDN